MKNNRNFSSRRAGRSSRVSLGGAWSNLLCFTGFLFCWSLEGQNELTFWRHKSCIYVFIYWQHILHTKAYKVNNMLVHQHHIFVKTSLYWSQIKLVMIWLHISKMVHRSFSWPTFGTWIIIVNMFACCNIPFCCCSYNKITRLIKRQGCQQPTRRARWAMHDGLCGVIQQATVDHPFYRFCWGPSVVFGTLEVKSWRAWRWFL